MTDKNESEQLNDKTTLLEDEEKIVETNNWVTDTSDEPNEIPDADEALAFDHALDEDLEINEDEDDFVDSLGMDIASGPEVSESHPEVSIESESAGVDVPESVTVSTSQLEEALERVIEKMLSAKIERILSEVIEKAVTKEMEKLKGILLDNEGSEA